MKLYLYLTQKEWSKTWIEGGRIPITLASKYLSDDRLGTKTPDENNQRILKNLGEENIAVLGNMDSIPTIAKSNFNIKIGTMRIGDKVVAKDVEYKRRYEDGYILSFSTKLDNKIMQRLGKSACVEIMDYEKLFANLDKQMEGSDGVHDSCKYSAGNNRNVFLKSTKDEWQQEYRFYWKIDHQKEIKETIELIIPTHTAKIITI